MSHPPFVSTSSFPGLLSPISLYSAPSLSPRFYPLWRVCYICNHPHEMFLITSHIRPPPYSDRPRHPSNTAGTRTVPRRIRCQPFPCFVGTTVSRSSRSRQAPSSVPSEAFSLRRRWVPHAISLPFPQLKVMCLRSKHYTWGRGPRESTSAHVLT